ncbi:MAG: Hint domain-containing protein, partial [Candidatus Thermoplasmatota archaeon]
ISSDITYDVDDYIGLGRAKLIIPGVQYYCRIGYLFAQYTNNYLYIYPDIKELPAFASDIDFTSVEYFISIAPYQHSTPLPNIFIHEANTLNYWGNRPLFRNGWIYMHSGNKPPEFENGVFGFYAPIIRYYNYLTNSITNFSFTISSSHTLMSISVYVAIPFNGTNNKIDIGISGSPSYFIKDLDVSTRGWKYFVYENPLPQYFPGATYVGQYKGTGATQGKVEVYFDVYMSSVSGRCLWEQRIRKNIVYPGQAITFSCFLARDAVFSAGGINCGTFSFYIKPETNYIFDGYFSMPSMSNYQASIPLSVCKGRTLGGNLQYEYVVLYGQIPTNYNWDDVKYVRIGMIADWGQNDIKYNYIMTKPMLNYGNEAAPYTNRNHPDRLTMYSPSEYIPGNTPPNHDEDDPMCLAEGQYITMWDGKMKRIEELKTGEMVRSIGMTSTIKYIEKALDRETMVFIMEGNHILECTPEHLCLTDIFVPKPAKDIKIGDAMLTMDNKRTRVIDIRRRRNNVYKIETSLPHIFLVNGIWTHNIKAGGGEY